MLPALSLLLCTAFVLFLLRLERQAAPDTSWALWIPTVWMFITSSRPLVEWFSYVGSGGVTLDNDSGSALDRWVLIALGLSGIVVLAYRRINWWDCLRRQKWLLALLAFMFLSTFWSEITLIAMKRWSRELIVLIMALVIQSEASPRQALESIFRRTAYVLLPFSIVLIKYCPWLGVRYGRWSGTLMWVGVGSQKNELGRLCMISCFFLAFAVYRGWRDRASTQGNRHRTWADAFIMLLGFYLLKGSASATSLVTLFLGVSTFIGLRYFHKRNFAALQPALWVLVILLMAFGVATPFLGGSNVASLTGSLGRDDTLTGRTEVWALVLPARAQHPLLGYGLGSFWTDARRELYDIPTSHNGYLDILLELGEVGLGVYTVWLLSCTRRFHQALAQDYDWASMGICLLLMGLLYNTTESSINSLTEQMTVVVVFTSFVLSKEVIPIASPAKSRAAPASKWAAYRTKLQPWAAATKTKTWHEV